MNTYFSSATFSKKTLLLWHCKNYTFFCNIHRIFAVWIGYPNLGIWFVLTTNSILFLTSKMSNIFNTCWIISHLVLGSRVGLRQGHKGSRWLPFLQCWRDLGMVLLPCSNISRTTELTEKKRRCWRVNYWLCIVHETKAKV